MKIVFLETKTLGVDVSLKAFEEFGEVVCYDVSDPDKNAERAKDADILIVNKIPMNAETLAQAENLKLICLTATGTNNLDKEYLISEFEEILEPVNNLLEECLDLCTEA